MERERKQEREGGSFVTLRSIEALPEDSSIFKKNKNLISDSSKAAAPVSTSVQLTINADITLPVQHRTRKC